MKMSQTKLNEIVRLHGLWLAGDPAGVRADLRGADLTEMNLMWANLARVNLTGADLTEMNLTETNLMWANLTRANLTGVKLTGTNLKGANLTGADLTDADLTDADLTETNLTRAVLPEGVKIVSVSGIGSSRRMTTYRIDTDEVWCGCFKGTLKEFSEAVESTHVNNPEHLTHYRGAIAFFTVQSTTRGLTI